MNPLKRKYNHIPDIDYFHYFIGLKAWVFYDPVINNKVKYYSNLPNSHLKSYISRSKDIVEYYNPDDYPGYEGMAFRFRFQDVQEALNNHKKNLSISPGSNDISDDCLEIFRQDLILFTQLSDSDIIEFGASLKQFNLKSINEVWSDWKNSRYQNTPEAFEIKLEKKKDHILDPDLIKLAIKEELDIYDKWLKDQLSHPDSGYNYMVNCKLDEEVVEIYKYARAKNQVEMYEYLKKRLNEFDSTIISIPISPKFKTNISVDQLTCLFKIIENYKIIEIKSGQHESFKRFISESFSSKNEESIALKSFRNKYRKPELSSYKFWVKKFREFVINIKSQYPTIQ